MTRKRSSILSSYPPVPQDGGPIPPSPAYKQQMSANGIAGSLGNIGTTPVIVGGSTMLMSGGRTQQYPSNVLSVNTNIIQAMRLAGTGGPSIEVPLSPRARP